MLATKRRLMLVLLVAMFIAVVPAAGCREEREIEPIDIKCRFRLKQIGLALHAYHQKHGAFPPAIVRDSQGRPMHSWRVLILPFVEEQELYDQYDFSQPWDSEHNRRLLQRMPKVFRCPDVASAGSTPYLAIVGNEMAWLETGANAEADFQDGLENTIVLVEVPGKAVPWTEPTDLNIPNDGLLEIGNNEKPASGVVNVLFGDGSVYSISTRLPASRLKPALTRNAGDKFDKELLQEAGDH